MAPQAKMFLVRRVGDGTMRTVVSTSERAAMTKFFVDYPGADVDEDFMIKERGAFNDWTTYRYQGCGRFRKVPS